MQVVESSSTLFPEARAPDPRKTKTGQPLARTIVPQFCNWSADLALCAFLTTIWRHRSTPRQAVVMSSLQCCKRNARIATLLLSNKIEQGGCLTARSAVSCLAFSGSGGLPERPLAAGCSPGLESHLLLRSAAVPHTRLVPHSLPSQE